MQEQMNSMSDSGEFQEVESNHGGRLSHVASQPEVIPSSSSICLSATNTCHLIHGMHLGYRKTVLIINVLQLVQPEILLEEFIMVSHMKHEERQNQFHEQ